ncbi:MAG: LamG-like jellyroll fold domain-containing protein, partial [Verrucomicrobiia bacterium]
AARGEAARNASTYTFLGLGADRKVGGGDDRVIGVTPAYQDGSVQVTLALSEKLSEGLYRLTIKSGGAAGIEDLAGRPLDQNRDGFGEDAVIDFEADFTAPTVASVSAGSALSFDGTNDFVRVMPSDSLKMTSAVTVEAWVYPTGQGGSSWATILNKEGEYELWRGPDGMLWYAVANSSPGWTGISTGGVIPLNQWTHVALTYDGAWLRAYVNGLLVHSLAGSGVIGDRHTDMNDLRIGGRAAATEYFKGSICEVRVWNVARSGAEIQANLGKRMGGTETGLVGYWRLDEGKGEMAADSSGHSNDGWLGEGAAANAPVWVGSGAPVGHKQVRVVYQDVGGMDPGSAGNPANYRLVGSGGDGTFGDGNEVALVPQSVEFDPETGVAVLRFGALIGDDFYRCTVDGTSGVTDAAGNGLLGGADYVSDAMAIETGLAAVGLDLAPGSDSGFSDSDNVTNVTRPVLDVVVGRRGLIEVDFDGDGTFDLSQSVDSTSAYPVMSSVDLAEGTRQVTVRLTPWVGVPAWAALPVTVNGTAPVVSNVAAGSALWFDGSDDYLSVSGATVPVGNDPYTIEAWIKPDQMGTRGIVGWGQWGAGNQTNALRLTGDGLLNYWWGNDLAASTGSLVGAWHHVAASFDGTYRRLYLDGTLVAEDRPSGHGVPDGRNLRIGSTNNGEFFAGQIDEVRIWVVARSAEEIRGAMYERLAGTEQGLTGYWRFDEGTGLLAGDASGKGNTGVLGGGNAQSVPVWTSSSVEMSRAVLRVTFADANGMDSRAVSDKSSYRVEASGGDRTFGDGNEADVTWWLAGVNWNADTLTATLAFDRGLAADVYRVIVPGTAGVRDAAGNRLLNGADYTSAGIGVVDRPAEITIDLRAESDTGLSSSDNFSHFAESFFFNN